MFVFLGPHFTAQGNSQARGRIGAAAAGLHHSHSNTRSEPHLQSTPQLRPRRIPNPRIKARDRTCILMDVNQVTAEPREFLFLSFSYDARENTGITKKVLPRIFSSFPAPKVKHRTFQQATLAAVLILTDTKFTHIRGSRIVPLLLPPPQGMSGNVWRHFFSS